MISFVYDKCRFDGTDQATQDILHTASQGARVSLTTEIAVVRYSSTMIWRSAWLLEADENPKIIEGHETLGPINLHYISALMPILERIALSTGRVPHIDGPNLVALENGGTKFYSGRSRV